MPLKQEVSQMISTQNPILKLTTLRPATSFIIPEILASGTTPTALFTYVPVPFTHFFDLSHFNTSLTTSCPQIHLYSHANDLWDKPSTAQPVLLSPSTLSPLLYETILLAPQNWSSAFKSHLNSSYTRPISPTVPVLVELHLPLLQFPLSYDSPNFVANFGKILRFKPEIRRLAASVVYALSQKYNLHLSSTSSIEKGKFYGAHLRTALDAQAAGWTPYANQSSNYLFSAAQLNFSTIYVVSANEADVSLFTTQAANASSPIAVETKVSLLGGPLPAPFLNDEGHLIQGERIGRKGFEAEWKELKALTDEQQGVVDYEVLLRSSAFGGTWESSFGWGVAMRRHVVASGRSGWKAFSAPPEVMASAEPKYKAKKPSRRGEWEIQDVSEEVVHRSKRDLEELESRVESVVERGVRPGVKEAAIEKAKENIKNGGISTEGAKLAEHCFLDGLSVVFGPKGEGKVFELAMWP
jgi:hypothetical protein